MWSKKNICVSPSNLISLNLYFSVFALILLAFHTASTSNQSDDAFYQTLNESLRNSDRFRMYSKRVDCILKDLKSEKSITAVNKSLYEFKQQTGKNDFKVIFVNESAVMSQLDPHLNRANFSCTIIGYAAIIFICTILIIVLSCVACISKK